MTELDTERIGQELRMSWSAYLIKHEPAIIAALEDRERLRAAAQRVCNAVDPPAALVDWCKVPSADILALQGALESRDG